MAGGIFLIYSGHILHRYGGHLYLLWKRVAQFVKNIISDKKKDHRDKKCDTQLFPADHFPEENTILVSPHDVGHRILIHPNSQDLGFLSEE